MWVGGGSVADSKWQERGDRYCNNIGDDSGFDLISTV